MILTARNTSPVNRRHELNRVPFKNHPDMRPSGAQFRPLLNVMEREEAFVLELAAPGLNKEDFKIEVEKNRLSIHVERKQEEADTEMKILRHEFGVYRLERTFMLSDEIDVDHIEGKYEAGVLSVTLPKSKKTRVRTINVG